MRLSKRRIVLRIVLLAAAGAFMGWRALVHLEASAPHGEAGRALRRLGLVEALLAALALALAGFVALALRPRPRRRPLGLGSAPHPPGAGPGAEPPSPSGR